MAEPTSSQRVAPAWLSPLILLAAAAVLARRWDQIPDRWVVHWSARGIPNGWANKSPLGVYAPLLGGGLLWLIMESATAIVRARAGRDPALAALETATTQLLRLLSVAISLLFGLLAITLPLGPHVAPGAIVVTSLGLVLGAVLIGTRGISRALERARREGHSERLKGYRGIYYSNPEDHRLWVPKLMGLGLTINFANPWAWPMMLLLAGVPIAIVILGLLASAR
jgi:uncharacterized membrane protein